MATYATRADIDELYGTELLARLTDDRRAGEADQTKVDRGLEAADNIVNSYISERYTLPLPVVPGALRECAVDIAVYKIALSTTKRTPEMRTRYEDAIALLERIGCGKAGLGLTDEEASSGNNPIDNAPSRLGRSITTIRVG